MSFTGRAVLAALIVMIDLLLFFVPLVALLAAYVALARPEWFPKLVQKIYHGQQGRAC